MTDTSANNLLQTPAKASRRGFASMDPQKQREIASLGGRAAHRSGNAHQFTPEEARRAGSMSRRSKADTTDRSNEPGGL